MRKSVTGGNRGMTLIELIVAMAISSIVFALIFSFFVYNTKIYTAANNQLNIQQNCTEILESLTTHAKESASIDDTERSAGKYIFIKPDNAKVFITFDKSAAQLTINTQTYEYISDFSITSQSAISGSLWEIDVTGKRKNDEKSFSATVSLRN